VTTWFAVHTKPRREVEAKTQLCNQGFEAYLPRIQFRKRRKGRWIEFIEPLFPRYLFIEVDPTVQSIAPVRNTFGVSGLVCFGGEP
jgi:transcriptional antiterminator RfaH